MDIAITGSTGLIGTALKEALGRAGHTIVPVVRSQTSGDGRVVRWDPAKGEIDAAALEGVDAVVHLAGAGIGDQRWSAERKREIIESRVRGTGLLTTTLAGLDRKPKVLLSGSAIGYYGDRGDEVLTEDSAAGDTSKVFLSEICVAWEDAAQPAIDAGIRTAKIRTGIVLTPKGGALRQLLPLFKLGLGGKMGSGDQWMSWISLEDEVGAIRWILDHDDIAGPVNLTAPSPVTNAQLATELGRALGRPSFLPVPAFGPRLLKGRELADELLFASQRVQPTVLEASGFPFKHPTLPAALKSLVG